MAHQLERCDVVLGLGQQVDGQEPARQRELGGLEERAADDAARAASHLSSLPYQSMNSTLEIAG